MVSTQSSTALLELHHYPASLGMYVVINSLSTSYLLSRLLLVYSKFLPLINLQVIEWLEYAPTFLSGSEFENACSFVVLVMCLVVYY